jgi:hypothetical protein
MGEIYTICSRIRLIKGKSVMLNKILKKFKFFFILLCFYMST